MRPQNLLLTGLVIALILLCVQPVLADFGLSVPSTDVSIWTTALAWLVPVGLGLLACGTVAPGRVATVIRLGWLALGIATIVYWLYGFAFQFGGVGFISEVPGLSGLAREWSWRPWDEMWGTQWGIIGLTGYVLSEPAATEAARALFFAQLPWITTAVAIPLWSLQGRTKPIVLVLSGLLTASLFALIGNWSWGGGWLANLGLNLGLGHGFVDLGGAGAIHLAGAASALAGMLAFGTRARAHRGPEQLALPTLEATTVQAQIADDGETYVPMPPLHLPLLATLGVWLALVGLLGWMANTPARLTAALAVSQVDMGIGLLLAAAGGALTTLAFSWLTTGQGNALMVARGVLGALVAASSGQPFLPLWAMLAVGAAAGLLVPLVQYLIEHLLRLDDPTSAVATHGTSALWGLLAVGIFAGGHVDGGSIAGLIHGEWGQFRAQATGAATIAVASFCVSWLLFAAVQGLTRAWQGEYTIRLPRRPRARPKSTHKTTRRGPRIRFARAQEENVSKTETTGAAVEAEVPAAVETETSEAEAETAPIMPEQAPSEPLEDIEPPPDAPQDEG